MEQPKFNLKSLQPEQIADDFYVKEKFIKTLSKIHGMSEVDAELICEREAIYYKQALAAEPKLKACTNISLFAAFLEIAINGLSIQKGSKSEAYLEPRGTNTGTRDNPIWTNNCRFVITAYGELNMRIKAGQIIRMNNPIVLYECDHFQPMTNQRGELVVDYKPAIPRTSKNIMGCYVCIVLPGNGLDFKWLLQDDIDRLSNYSKPKSGQNARANALYSSNNGQIDPGFLEAKTIKHAMRSYTKLRVSDVVSMEGDDEFEETTPTAVVPEQTHTPIAEPGTVILGTDENEPF